MPYFPWTTACELKLSLALDLPCNIHMFHSGAINNQWILASNLSFSCSDVWLFQYCVMRVRILCITWMEIKATHWLSSDLDKQIFLYPMRFHSWSTHNDQNKLQDLLQELDGGELQELRWGARRCLEQLPGAGAHRCRHRGAHRCQLQELPRGAHGGVQLNGYERKACDFFCWRDTRRRRGWAATPLPSLPVICFPIRWYNPLLVVLSGSVFDKCLSKKMSKICHETALFAADRGLKNMKGIQKGRPYLHIVYVQILA